MIAPAANRESQNLLAAWFNKNDSHLPFRADAVSGDLVIAEITGEQDIGRVIDIVLAPAPPCFRYQMQVLFRP